MNVAQRAIWSFARFVPKELVQRVIEDPALNDTPTLLLLARDLATTDRADR